MCYGMMQLNAQNSILKVMVDGLTGYGYGYGHGVSLQDFITYNIEAVIFASQYNVTSLIYKQQTLKTFTGKPWLWTEIC